jgi:WD40 repeat protein
VGPDGPQPAAGPGSARRRAVATPKEEFEAVAEPDGLWWRRCQELLRGVPDGGSVGVQLRLLSEEEGRLGRLGGEQASSPEDGRAFKAAIGLAGMLTRALAGDQSGAQAGSRDVVAAAARFWSRSGLLVPQPDGAAVSPGSESAASLQAPLRERVRALGETIGELPASSSRAMVLVTALRLAGLQSRRRHVTQVPVLFDKAGCGVSGVLRIRELPGAPAGLYPDPAGMSFAHADEEFTGALAAAWGLAVRGRPANRCFLWQLTLSDGEPVPFLRGGSLGAAFAVTLREHFRKQWSLKQPWAPVVAAFFGLRRRCAITGAITDGGRLGAVGGMEAKFAAARARNWRLVAPADNRDAAVHVPDGLHVYWAATLREASWSARRWHPVRTSIAVLALALVVTVSVAMRLHDQFDSVKATATASQLITDSGTVADSDPALSRLEAVAAWRLTPSSAGARLALLRAASLPQLAVLGPAASGIQSLAYSPDGTLLATAFGDPGGGPGGMLLWDTRTKQESGGLLTNAGLSKGIGPMSFSPDGTMLAVGTVEGTVELWDVATRRQIGNFATDPYSAAPDVSSIAFSHDSKTLAVANLDGTGHMWDVATGRQLGSSLRLTKGSPPSAMAFSPDDKALETVIPDPGAAAGTEPPGEVATWDVATHQQAGVPFSLTGTYFPVRGAVAFSPDGATLAVGSYAPQLWSVSARKRIAALPRPPGEPAQADIVTFSPDGETLATYDGNGATQVWDTATWQVIAVLPAGRDPVGTMAFSPDGQELAMGSNDGTTRLWDVAAASPFTAADAMGSVASFPASQTLAATVAGHPGWVRLWDMATGRPIGTLPSADPSDVGTAAFSANGKVLAVGYNDGTVRLWDVPTRKLIGGPLPYPGEMSADARPDPAQLAFSPDGKMLLTGYFLGRAQLWDVATATLIRTLPVNDSVTAVAVSPDGETLVTADNMEIQLWNAVNGRQAGAPLSTSAAPFSLAFSPNGKTLAAGYFNGQVRLWDLATRQQAGGPVTVTGVYDSVDRLAFNPEGTALAAGSADGTVRLIDVPTWQPIGAPLVAAGYVGAIQAVAFSRDGKTLVTGASAGTLQWHVGYLSNPVPYLCAVAGQSVPPAEWTRHVPGVAYQSVCPAAKART